MHLFIAQLDFSKLNARGLIKEAGGGRDSLKSSTTAIGADTLHLRKTDEEDIHGIQLDPDGELTGL